MKLWHSSMLNKYQLCLLNIHLARISLVCSRPACILLACMGFGQETRANAPSPTSNGCQAPLNVTGWLESSGGGVEEWEARAPSAKKRHQATVKLISVRWIQPAEAVKANQMQRELLCATVCLVQPGSVWGGGTATVQLKLTADELWLLHFIVLTASFRAGIFACRRTVQDLFLPCLGHSGSCRVFLLLPAAVFIGFCVFFSSTN